CRGLLLRFETTVQHSVEASGVGLHSGVPVQIRILPAPISTGIVFLRTDLDNFQIAASWRNVARVSYATSLMRQGVLISTTPDLLHGSLSPGGSHTAEGDIITLEFPTGGGGAPPSVTLLEGAATPSSRRRRRSLRTRRPVTVEDKGKRISILPAESFRLTCD